MNYNAIATLNILSAVVTGLPEKHRAAARAVAFAAAKVMFGLTDDQWVDLVAADVKNMANNPNTNVTDVAKVTNERLEAFEAYVKAIKPKEAFATIEHLWNMGADRNGNARTPLTIAQFGGSKLPSPTDAFAQLGL